MIFYVLKRFHLITKMTRLEKRRNKQEGELRRCSRGQSRSGETLSLSISSEAMKWKDRIHFGGGSDGNG